MYLFGILSLVAATAALRVLPDPPTLPKSVAAPHQGSEMQIYNQRAATASASLQDIKDNKEIKKGVFKIGSVIFPPPPQLQLLDHSVLRKQKAAQKQKYEDTVKQIYENAKKEYFTKHAAEQSKEDKDAVSLDLEKPVKVEVPANLATLIDSVTAAQHCELCSNIFIVETDSDLVTAKKDDEEVKPNKVEIASINIPAPPELTVFDYSTLEKQLTEQKQKSEEALKQEAKKSEKLQEVVIPDQENPVKVTDRPNALEESEFPANIIHLGTVSAPVADEKDDEEVENGMAKIATIVIPSPPELPPFDYSILRQQKAEYNLKSEYSATQAAERSKEEKEALMLDLEKPVKIEMPDNPATFKHSVTAAQDSEVRSNIFVAAPNSALVADKKYDEEVKPNMVKIASIVIPAPPELPPFDYSILEKQLADQKQKSEEALKQEAKKSKKLKEAVILDQVKPVKVRVRPNPATLTSFVPALEESDGRANIIRVGTVSAPVLDEKDNEEVEHGMAKIATIVIPSPPELPPFDYSILRQQKAEYNLKSEYSATEAAEKSKEEKEALMLDLEKPEAEVPANPATLKDSVTAAQDSEVRSNIFIAATNSALVADKKFDEEVKPNMVKIASIVIPAPPELPPFDYSILEKQLADQKQKSEEALKQEAKKSKKLKEAVILDQVKPVKVRVRPNPATLTSFVPALEESEGRANIIHVGTVSAPVADEKDDEEVEHSMAKIATIVIPSPPELPPFDYSILRQQKAEYNLKSEYSAKEAAEKSKEEEEALMLDLEKPEAEVPANPATLKDSVTAAQDSEVRSNIFIAATNSALVADKKYDEEVKPSTVKIASIVIPAPPELPPFDYSILEKQLADQKQKSEEALKQEAKKSKKLKEAVILDQEKPVKVRVRPNPATLTSFVPALEESEGRANIINVGTVSAPVADEKDDEEIEHGMAKIATIVIPSPPELPPFDYSILRQQKAEYNLKSEYSATEAAEKSKEEKEALMLDLEKPEAEVPANPATLKDSVTAAQDSEVRSNIFIAATNSALVADKKFDEEVKPNMVKIASIVIPAPPELPPFDYSILEKQLADQKQKSEEALKQEAKKSKKLKEAVILDQVKPVKVRVRPNPATLTSFVPALEESEGRANIINVGTVSAPVADEKDDEEVEHGMAKIATIVIPSPPELPPFDYSILRQQKAEYNLKSEYSATEAAEKSKEEKEALMLDLEKPEAEVPANPATLKDSVTAAQDSEVRSNIFIAATNSALVADKKYDEEVKPNMVKIASIVIPAPPELPPFDYSILEKQLVDQKHKSEEVLKQEATKSKKLKEAVILDQVKPVRVRVRPDPAILTSFVPALEKSEGRANIIHVGSDSAPVADEKDDEEVEHSRAKIATVIIPSPPELPSFDYSILKKHKADQRQKSDNFLKLEADKLEKKKDILFIEKPVEVKEPKLLEESPFVRDSNRIEESKPVEESKLIEVLKKEPVKHFEDIPVILQWTITSSPLVKKLISNNPLLPSFGLNWPLQRPSKSGHSCIICPKFKRDGFTYTN